MAAEREKALETAMNQIEKQFGKGSVMKMGDNLNMTIESIPTGALALDLALGSVVCLAAGLSRSTALSLLASPRSHCTSLPRRSEMVGFAPTSTRSTRWTRSTRERSASTSMSC